MPLWRTLALAVFLPLAPAFAEPTDVVNRTPPPVYQEQFASLLTPLSAVLPGREAFPDNKTGAIVLLSEGFRYRDASGTDYRLLHTIFHATSQAGVESLSSDTFDFDRERESIFLIDAATILPDGTRQSIEAKGAFIQTPQHEAENSLYTSQAELRLVYPKATVGATTEVIVLVRENIPVMPGEFAVSRIFGSGWPVFLHRFVVDLPDTDWARIHSDGTTAGVPDPAVETSAPGRERRTWTRQRVPAIPWENYSPPLAFRAPTLWLTTLRSWDDLAKWYDGQLATRSTIGPDLAQAVERATQGLTDRRAIIEALHALAANEVRYTGLEFGLAGYQPHSCDDVWQKRYGDCKDKANLLRAMLATKGIRSHLVLLSTHGNGQVEKRSPSWQQFNHAILAVENTPDLLICDPTGKHFTAGTLGLGDLARDVLVLRGDHAEWVHTPDRLGATTRIGAELELSAEGELSGWFTFSAEGSDAAIYTDFFNGLDQQSLREKLQGYANAFFAGAEVVDVDYQPVRGATNQLRCRAFLVRPSRAAQETTFRFPYPESWAPRVVNDGERRFPYFTSRRETIVDVSITPASNWSIAALPEPFSAPSAIARFEGAWRREGNRLTAHLAYHPERAELAPAEFTIYQRSVRALLAWMEQPARLTTANVAPSVAATSAPDELPNFPILPTAQGQFRLLEERFPEDAGKDPQRRAALGKVLQWFPQDIDAVFQARVQLADPALSGTDEHVFADTIALLLAQHGSQLSANLRSWGEYREACARWNSTKEPAALEKLQALARDEKLSLFRRGWSANSAGLALLSDNPAAAAAYLAPFAELDTDARPRLVENTARAFARAGDSAGLQDWVTRLTTRVGTDADSLLASAIKSVANDRAKIPAAQLPKVVAAFNAVIRDSRTFPRAFPELTTLRNALAVAVAQRQFVADLRTWLHEHPPAWWTRKKLDAYPTVEAVVARIESENKKAEAKTVLDAICQLLLHHEPDYPTFAKYTSWTLWYLNSRKLDDPMLDHLSRLALELPTSPSEDIIECWQVRAAFLRRTGDLAGARNIYNRVLERADAKEFQKVEAGGELGTLERDSGRLDEALAAWRRIEPIHAKHKHGVDYLYAALLVELDRGNYDRGLEIVAHLGEQDTKWIEAAYNAQPLKHLLRAGAHPEGLKRFWQQSARSIPLWNRLLTSNNLKPSAAPLAIDYPAVFEKLNKAVAARDRAAFLTQLEIMAHTARTVPLYTIDVAREAYRADQVAADLQNQLYECALPCVTDLAPVDPDFDLKARLWETLFLSNLQRQPEAAKKAQALYSELGPKDAIGTNALRLWATSVRKTPAEAEVLRTLRDLLSSNTPVADRLDTVRIYSDSLQQLGERSEHLALLTRETARPDFVRDGDNGKTLLARLDQLKREGASAETFTKFVSAWIDAPSRRWLREVHPLSLDEPRFAGRTEPMEHSEAGYGPAEQLKFNLLLALEATSAAEKRQKAFRFVVQNVARDTNDFGTFTELMLEAASAEALAPDSRASILATVSWWLAADRQYRLLEKCAAHPVYAALTETYRQSLTDLRRGLVLLDDPAGAKRTEAFVAVTEHPLDDLRFGLATDTLQAMVLAGDAAGAEALIAGSAKLETAAVLEKSPATVRLEWTRAVRRAREVAPFVASLRRKIDAFPETHADCPAAARNIIFTAARTDLTHAEIAALLGRRLRQLTGVVDDLDTFLSMLNELQMGKREQPDFALFESLLATPMNDQFKSRLLPATVSLTDLDDPVVAARIGEGLASLTTPTAARDQPQTAAAAMVVRARIALRSDRSERPEALFDPTLTKLIPPRRLTELQLQFHASRANDAQLGSLLDNLDPAVVAESDLLPYIDSALVRLDRSGERELYRQAAKEAFLRNLDFAWSAPHWAGARSSVYEIAPLDGFRELVSDAWFDHLAAVSRNELARAKLEVARAQTHRDLQHLKQACDKLLRLEPSLYDLYLPRARAEQALGQTDAARADYDTFLRYCLDSAYYPEALKARRELDAVAAR